MPAEEHTPERNFLNLVDALLLDQKRMLTMTGGMADRMNDMTSEIIKISRGQLAIQSQLAEFRAQIDARLLAIEHRFELVEQGFDRIERRFGKIEQRFDKIEQRFEQVDRRFEALSARMEESEQAIDRLARELHSLRIEVVTQANQILNAVQASHVAQIDVRDLTERVEELGARLDELERRISRI